MTTYNTNLASEFYVLSMLHRLGIDASLTLGNKKAVDIIVINTDGTITTIDVKGLAGPYDWPADNIHDVEHENHFYVFVSFEGKIADPLFIPSVWIVPAVKVSDFVKHYKTRVVISRAKIKELGGLYINAWEKIAGYVSR